MEKELLKFINERLISIFIYFCIHIISSTTSAFAALDSCDEGTSTVLVWILTAGAVFGLLLAIINIIVSFFEKGWSLLIIGLICFFILNSMCDAGL